MLKRVDERLMKMSAEMEKMRKEFCEWAVLKKGSLGQMDGCEGKVEQVKKRRRNRMKKFE